MAHDFCNRTVNSNRSHVLVCMRHYRDTDSSKCKLTDCWDASSVESGGNLSEGTVTQVINGVKSRTEAVEQQNIGYFTTVDRLHQWGCCRTAKMTVPVEWCRGYADLGRKRVSGWFVLLELLVNRSSWFIFMDIWYEIAHHTSTTSSVAPRNESMEEMTQ